MSDDQFLLDLSKLSPAHQRAFRHTINMFVKAKDQGYGRGWVVTQLKADARALQDIASFLQRHFEEESDE